MTPRTISFTSYRDTAGLLYHPLVDPRLQQFGKFIPAFSIPYAFFKTVIPCAFLGSSRKERLAPP